MGSLFLYNFVVNPFSSDAKFDFDKMRDVIKIGVRFLDNIIDVNSFPDKIYENYQKNLRTVGFGVTGLADCIAMLGMKYNSEDATNFVDRLMDTFSYEVYMASIELSKERGDFPFINRYKHAESNFINKHLTSEYNNWYNVKDGIIQYGIRNGKLISVAPTGTISLTFGNNCSSGIEPIFSLSYKRKAKIGGQDESNAEIINIQDYAYYLWCKDKKDTKEDVFVTAMGIDVSDHINMLKSIAPHVDMACSKTVNIPTDYPFEKTKDLFMKCWESGIKGVTIFRPNEIRKGILSTTEPKPEAMEKPTELSRGEWKPKAKDTVYYQRKIRIGCGKLSLFIGWSASEKAIQDLYVQRTGTGGCEKNIQSTVIAMSGMLRLGGNILNVEKAFDGLGACNSFVGQRAKGAPLSKGSSCGTAILNEIKMFMGEFSGNPNPKAEKVETKKQVDGDGNDGMAVCPECGEKSVVNEGNCVSCKSCGYSHCG